jgi:glycosyltransferase involved in cell wall biosynthesis
MREILIDVSRLLDRRMQGRLPTGVDRVSLEYVRHFAGRATALVRYAGQWIELSEKDSQRVFTALLTSSGNFNMLIRWLVIKAFPRSIGRNFSVPRFLFNTGHSGLEQPRYVNRLRRSALKPIFFVHDLIPLIHPEYCRAGEAGRHSLRMNTVLSVAHGVIANSATTLDTLAAYATANDLPLPPSVVASLAPASLPAPSATAPLNKPYFVVLGTIEPRKNHWLLLQVWRQLIARMGAAAPRLVIIGQRGWECESVVDLLERCAALQGFVLEHPACSDAELAGWLHHAQALLFPSFAEGYGMPLVEALAQGLPVIASDLAVFHEIAGDVPDYLDPLDGTGWIDRIADFSLPNSARRAAQLERIRHFRTPGWAEHFARVESWMDTLADRT